MLPSLGLYVALGIMALLEFNSSTLTLGLAISVAVNVGDNGMNVALGITARIEFNSSCLLSSDFGGLVIPKVVVGVDDSCLGVDLVTTAWFKFNSSFLHSLALGLRIPVSVGNSPLVTRLGCILSELFVWLFVKSPARLSDLVSAR